MNLTLFDLDGTLIPGDSDHAFGSFMVDIGWADGDAWRARNDQFYADYQAGQLDLDAYIEFSTAVWRARPLEEALAVRERFMAEVVAPMLQPGARDLVRRHQAAGDLLAVVTATNEFVTTPIAAAFGIVPPAFEVHRPDLIRRLRLAPRCTGPVGKHSRALHRRSLSGT